MIKLFYFNRILIITTERITEKCVSLYFFVQYVMLWRWINSGFNALSCIIMNRNYVFHFTKALSFMAHFLKIGQKHDFLTYCLANSILRNPGMP